MVNRFKCVSRWFEKFRSGSYSIFDDARSYRPVEFERNLWKAIVEVNPIVTLKNLHSNSIRPIVSLMKLKWLRKWIKLGKRIKVVKKMDKAWETDSEWFCPVNFKQEEAVSASLYFCQHEKPAFLIVVRIIK